MAALASIVAPVFAIIGLGYLAGRLRVLGAGASEILNGFVYYFALPPLFFVAVARAPLAETLHWSFLAAYGGGLALTGALAALGGGLLFARRGASLALHSMAALFGNTGYLGIPLFIAAFGPARALPAVLATVLNSALVLGLIIGVVEAARGRGASAREALADGVLSVLRNPLFIGAAGGLVLAGAGIAVPLPLARACDVLGAAAVPGALFALGLFLAAHPVRVRAAETAWLSALKLGVQPAITGGLVLTLPGLDAFWGASAILLAAMPSGALVFVLAQRFHTFERESSAAILVTTAVALPLLAALLARLAFA